MATFPSLSSVARSVLRPVNFQFPHSSFSTANPLLARTPFAPKSTSAKKETKPSGKSDKAKPSEKQTAPKRPPSAYNLFLKEKLGNRPENLTQRQYMAEVAKQFKTLNATQKAKFENSAAALRKEYDAKKQEESKPKRPPNIFALYVRDRMQQRPKGLKVIEFMPTIAADYKNLNETQRGKYEKIFRELSSKYLAEKEAEAQKHPPVKKRVNGYNLFFQEHMLNRADNVKGTREDMRKIAADWKSLSADMKTKYSEMAKEKNAVTDAAH